ncbi:hypothetical protein ACHAXT_008101 [Thalassiosira profunda]
MSSPTKAPSAEGCSRGMTPEPSRGRVGPSGRGIGGLWRDEARQEGLETTSNCAHDVAGGGHHHEGGISSIGDDVGRAHTSLSGRAVANHPSIASQANPDAHVKGEGAGRMGNVDLAEFVAQRSCTQLQGRRYVCQMCKPAGDEGDKGTGIAVESKHQGANLRDAALENYVLPVLHAQIGIWSGSGDLEALGGEHGE